MNICNRADSSNTFDISYDGVTYITRLLVGAAFTVGDYRSNVVDPGMYVRTLWLKCSDASGTATAEITCGRPG